jgi:hypothetical protein
MPQDATAPFMWVIFTTTILLGWWEVTMVLAGFKMFSSGRVNWACLFNIFMLESGNDAE